MFRFLPRNVPSVLVFVARILQNSHFSASYARRFASTLAHSRYSRTVKSSGSSLVANRYLLFGIIWRYYYGNRVVIYILYTDTTTVAKSWIVAIYAVIVS